MQIKQRLCEISIKVNLLIIIACCLQQLEFMKNLKAPFLAVALILFNISFVCAGTPPPPTARMASTAGTTDLDDEDSPGSGGEGFPINQNILILLIGGLVLGATVIYKNTKKASN